MLLVAMSGCAGLRPKAIQVSMKAFSEIPAGEELGPVAILPAREEVRDSLEFHSYVAVVEESLRRRGVTVVAFSEHPRLVGFLDTGIDNGQPVVSTYAIPRFGQTGVASSTTTGNVTSYGNSAFYSGTTTYQPQYGVTGYSTGTRTEMVFTRFVRFDIVACDQAMKYYETK